MRASTPEEFDAYLASRASVGTKELLADGAVVDGWRVTALLGCGGNGEVYRVERVSEDGPPRPDEPHGRARSPSAPLADGRGRPPGAPPAALKILSHDSDTACARFAREIELLSQNHHSAFPRYFVSGDVHLPSGNRRLPYYVMELLEPVELPQEDRAVAAYLLSVARAVAALHTAGLVHRDIKPQNVMRRANGELVLIDLGLVRPVSGLSGASGLTVTVEDGRAVGAGTPRYAAPEQFNGGAVSPATDIHALGMLANECFGGHPPRAWARIISRSTSSIPERRYADVGAFTSAIRHRHSGRIALGCAVGVLAMVGAGAVMVALGRATSMRSPKMGDPQLVLMQRGDVIDVALPTWRPPGAPSASPATSVSSHSSWRLLAEDAVVDGTMETVIRLAGKRHVFAEPMLLETNRAYRIQGPGTLDVFLEGKPGSTICLDNCVLLNRTRKPLAACGVCYVFRKGAYLNFINQPPNPDYKAFASDFDGAYNAFEFQGPETVAELLERRRAAARHRLSGEGSQ